MRSGSGSSSCSSTGNLARSESDAEDTACSFLRCRTVEKLSQRDNPWCVNGKGQTRLGREGLMKRNKWSSIWPMPESLDTRLVRVESETLRWQFVIRSTSGDIARFLCVTKSHAVVCLAHRWPSVRLWPRWLQRAFQLCMHAARGAAFRATVASRQTGHELAREAVTARANWRSARRIRAHCKFNGPRATAQCTPHWTKIGARPLVTLCVQSANANAISAPRANKMAEDRCPFPLQLLPSYVLVLSRDLVVEEQRTTAEQTYVML